MKPDLSWDQNPIRKSWSPQLISAVMEHQSQLDLGHPNEFVAGYDNLSPTNKIKFWCELLIEIIKFESNFDPSCIYHEPPPLGVDSIGLFQLSYQDEGHYALEPLSVNKKSLESPPVNIRCGVKIFAYWLAKDGVVTKGSGKQSRGAARYWSVMREGHHVKEIAEHVKLSMEL